MFHSAHYAGIDLCPNFQQGEAWEKVFGPVYIYLNAAQIGTPSSLLWQNAKAQVNFLHHTKCMQSFWVGHCRVQALDWIELPEQKVFMLTFPNWASSPVQAITEMWAWPYFWPASPAYPKNVERGVLYGQLSVSELYSTSQPYVIVYPICFQQIIWRRPTWPATYIDVKSTSKEIIA